MSDEGVFMASTKDRELEIIKKDNRLIEANYKITTNQWRVIISLLGKIRTDDKDFEDYTVNLAELAEFFKVTKSRSFYAEVQQATRDLMDTTIDISMGKRRRYTHFVSFVEYVEGEASILIRFDKALKPYLLNLQNNFTTYELAAVMNFKTSYGIRFYEFLKMRQNMGKGGQFYIQYSILELKEKLGIALDQYKYTKDFRVYVIEPALREIHEYSDLNILFEQIEYPKKGRAIYGVKIVAEPKKQRMLAIEDAKDVPSQESQPEQRPKAVQALLDFGFSESEARALVREHKSSKVLTAIAYVTDKKKTEAIKNQCLYLRRVLKGDGGEQWAKEQQEAQESRQKRLFEERQQANAEAERVERERAEIKQVQATFEALEVDEQEALLDAFLDELEASEANAFMLDRFHKARAKGEAHRVPMLYAHFKRVMREHGFI
jgi:plasmid replication initiation protein